MRIRNLVKLLDSAGNYTRILLSEADSQTPKRAGYNLSNQHQWSSHALSQARDKPGSHT